MNLELNQVAVWWSRLGPTGYGGHSYDDPVEIDCRWQASDKIFIDESGEKRQASAVVFVDVDMKPGDYLLLSNLEDVESSVTPVNADGAMMVKMFDKSPDLAGDEFVRCAYV